MPACSPEIGDEIAHQPDGVHHAHFCGIDMLKEMTGSTIGNASLTNARADMRLVRHDAMHIDPQVLFIVRLSDQIILAQEPRTP